MKRTYVNIIMFLVWVILLGVSRQYIQNNPAEKQWLISSYDTISQKIIWRKEQLFQKNWDLYKQKIQLLSNYKEIYTTIVNSSNPKCKQLDSNSLSQKTLELDNITTSQYESRQNDFLEFILDYKNRIDMNCK